MTIINCLDDFKSVQKKARAMLAEIESKTQIKVHLGSCGIASGANKVEDAFRQELNHRNLTRFALQTASCIGLCDIEPVVTIVAPGQPKVIYVKVDPAKVSRIVEEHLLGGAPIKEWTFNLESPRMRLQEIRVLRNQDLDPNDIELYIARGGYSALAKVLFEMQPEAVIQEIAKAGLRGRGGAGFPTARKWQMVRDSVWSEKHVVCNGDEGDPGAYMNRAVLEGNPHSLIEGMSIGAYAIGNVRQGYAYIRAEYPLAIETLTHAIEKAQEYGFLGKNIFGTDFEFALDIFPGAGAFVCGEETGLLTSIEGKRGNPRQRPPYPSNVGGGLFGRPTTLNNVETWSDVPEIIYKGADWFASVGNEKCKGTKTLCLVGKIANPGLVEVPLGTSLGKIIFDIGGGITEGKKFKAVQLGGPSGGVIPVEYLNTPVDYDAIPLTGAIMGSGGVVVMDENSCMVDVAKYFLDFNKDESCGKCAPCRAGTPQMLVMLDKISKGEGTLTDLDKLLELGETMTNASLCGLGQTSANPVLTTLRYFRDEYEAHIIDKKCSSAVCRGLFKSPCQHTCPVELDIPGYVSLIKAGRFADAYTLIKQRNPLPLVCGRVCDHPCEAKCNRAKTDAPLAIRDLKRFVADWAAVNGIRYQSPAHAAETARVAVIGAGPAGLSAAWDLALEGFPVTIFEAGPVAGGMLATAIPEYRLPKAVLRHEIEDLQRIGIDIKLNTPVNSPAELLKSGYQAVFIATGAPVGTSLGIPGENLSGVWNAINFLKQVNLGGQVKIGRKVAVVGGGNSAIDSARVAIRQGAREVHLIYRREKSDMPALEEEIQAAEQEGVILHTLTNPVKILGNPAVSGLQLVRQELGEFNRSGRKIARPVAGSEFNLAMDTVIMAIGQKADSTFVSASALPAKDGRITVDPRTLYTGISGLFAGGDAVTGPKTVIDAIAQGQRAASSIRRYLKHEDLTPRVHRNGYQPVSFPQTPATEVELKEKPRVKIPSISLAKRKKTFQEVTLALSEQQARAEACRCMRCDLEV